MAAEPMTEPGNLQVAMTAMANEFGAAASRRVNRADQLGSDAATMWSIAMTTPTTNSALAFQTATGQIRIPASGSGSPSPQ